MSEKSRDRDRKNALRETNDSILPLDRSLFEAARKRLDSLTKPPGSLGELERFAERIVAIRGDERPSLKRKAVFVLAGDHGVTAEGVSPYPREVTREMVMNFLRGGAAINALARHAGADVFVVDMGVDFDFPAEADSTPDLIPGLIHKKVGRGTRNFLRGKAMTEEEALGCVEAGVGLAREASKRGYEIIAAGEMGIGSTTAAAAVLCALLELAPGEVAGYGSGTDPQGLKRKVKTIEKALSLHRPSPQDPLEALSCVGGFEIGGIAGLILGAAASRIPAVVDGFVSTAGASIALGLSPQAMDYLFFSHLSREGGHGRVLERLGAKPILDLGMRLGEGTGAVLAMGVIEAAIRAYNEMATFEEAGVSRSG